MTRVPTQADAEIRECLAAKLSFSVVAGAGSGKTTSLVDALASLLKTDGARMLRDGQQVVCITYTNRAVDVISKRLRNNPLFVVSTLHGFLWGEIRHFQKSIREGLRLHVLPKHIAKQRGNDDGGGSKKSLEARRKAEDLEAALAELDSVPTFRYGNDTPYSNYKDGEIGHDDLVLLAAGMIQASQPLRRVLGQKYPYIFVDEAQDASPFIVAAFNSLCVAKGPPIVGYFGDPMQQIYDDGMGDFGRASGTRVITKNENFRCAPEVISLLNAFRKDVAQFAAGSNALVPGSVGITLVAAEKPSAPRGRYSEDQLQRAQDRFAEALNDWGWQQNENAKRLFLARRMIARRQGFLDLHDLFNGTYASSRANTEYEAGTHHLLKPFVETIIPLVMAHRTGDAGAVMRVLTTSTAAFRSDGTHSRKSIREVRSIANEVTTSVIKLFATEDAGRILRYCRDHGVIYAAENLCKHLDRPPRQEAYEEEKHLTEKGDWLADAFFVMRGSEIENYYKFLDENSPYSTQHGVKGEEYDDVIVVFDDVEAAWNNYSFSKLLTPRAAGSSKDTQQERSRKLAYVCFSRAVCNLRVLLFTPDPDVAALELATQGFFDESQIKILH